MIRFHLTVLFVLVAYGATWDRRRSLAIRYSQCRDTVLYSCCASLHAHGKCFCQRPHPIPGLRMRLLFGTPALPVCPPIIIAAGAQGWRVALRLCTLALVQHHTVAPEVPSDGPPKQISFGFIKGLPGRLCSPFGPGDRFGVLEGDMGA